MSTGDLRELLNTPKLFLFLPAVDHVFLFATTQGSHEFLLALLSVAASAVTYNIIDGIPYEAADQVKLRTSAIFILSGVSWIVVLGTGLVRLKAAFQVHWILPEVLFFTTIGFIMVVLSHIVLLSEDQYENVV